MHAWRKIKITEKTIERSFRLSQIGPKFPVPFSAVGQGGGGGGACMERLSIGCVHGLLGGLDRAVGTALWGTVVPVEKAGRGLRSQ